MQRPGIGVRKRMIFCALLTVLVYLGAELSAFVGYFMWRGGIFSWSLSQTKRHALLSSAPAPLEQYLAAEVLHPYLGYVLDPAVRDGVSEHGFWGKERFAPVGAKADHQIVIGLLGGSFAEGTSRQGREFLLKQIQRVPGFEGKECVVHTIALAGYKQPQQLLALTYFLSLGAQFDVLINLDGFNEVALPAFEHIPKQVFPFFPMSWFWKVRSLRRPELLTLIGRRSFLMKRRQTVARICAGSPFRYHVVSNVLWELYDAWSARQISEQHLAAVQYQGEPQDQPGYLVSGPSFEFSDEAELYDELVKVWQRSSMQMHKLSLANQIEYFHFLQPNQYVRGSKILTEDERKVAYSESHPYKKGVEKGYPRLVEAGKRLKDRGVRFYDLSMLFEDNDEGLYVDSCCHLNARGYEIVAGRIGEALYEALH